MTDDSIPTQENEYEMESNIEYVEPVLNRDNKPMWLCATKQKVATSLPHTPADIVIKNDKPLEEVTTFDLKKPSLWRCYRCGNTIQSNPHPPTYCRKEDNGCGRESTFKQITPKINIKLWEIPKYESITPEDLEMQRVYNDILNVLKQTIVFPETIHYKLFALWAISSWKIENWDTIPFLIFRGLIESGKSRALDLLTLLNRRFIQCAGVTFPAMVRATDRFNAGLAIDEIDSKLNKKSEIGQMMVDFLKPSYRKGSKYVVADKDDQDGLKVYNNFGYKALAGEHGGMDKAMFSRSIDFQMQQATPDVQELELLTEEFERLRTRLLNYRYKTNDPPTLEDIPETKQKFFRNRDREIFSCLIRTAEHIEESTSDIFDYIKQTQKNKQAELENTDEYLILKAIKEIQEDVTCNDAPTKISYNEICDYINNYFDVIGWDTNTDPGKRKRQRMGYIFHKDFNLRTKRTGEGTVVLLNDTNQKKLNSLYRRYDLVEKQNNQTYL